MPEKPQKTEKKLDKAQPVAEKKPEKEKKAKDRKSEREKKPNAIVVWWHETVGELRKVAWPSRADATRLTMIVLAVLVVMSVLLGGSDFGFAALIKLLYS